MAGILSFFSLIMSGIKLLLAIRELFKDWTEVQVAAYIRDLQSVVDQTKVAKTPEEKSAAAQKWVDIIARRPSGS